MEFSLKKDAVAAVMIVVYGTNCHVSTEARGREKSITKENILFHPEDQRKEVVCA